MRRGYDRVEDSIGRSYDEIKGVTISMSSETCVHIEPVCFKSIDNLLDKTQV